MKFLLIFVVYQCSFYMYELKIKFSKTDNIFLFVQQHIKSDKTRVFPVEINWFSQRFHLKMIFILRCVTLAISQRLKFAWSDLFSPLPQ